ncbi:MAG: MFS transporter [Patescibacteria group bacterium]|nr:MFS transporter [Patescibacteria group bacterium]MDE2438241.1 MFS transporter [Patescibacteria group bacterium]
MEPFKLSNVMKINKLVRFFVLSDLFLLMGWGFVEPVFALFVVQRIVGATLITVGWAAAIYLIVRALLQTPIALILDRLDGESDDFYTLVMGLLLLGVTAFLYTSISGIWEFYFVQGVRAIAMACYGATWPAIFGRHLDANRHAFEWSLDSTIVGIGAGISGVLGSAIANAFGFSILFFIVGIMSLLSAAIIMLVPHITLPRKSLQESFFLQKDHSTLTH